MQLVFHPGQTLKCPVNMSLLIGSPGVGKTLLLKRLSACSNKGSYDNIGEAPSTIPTVGTNLVNVLTSRKQEVTVRELGGCMAPIWHNYYRDCPAVMFMVDMANRTQVSATCIQLLDVLTNDRLQFTAVLIILNKIDMPNAMTRTEFDTVVRLDQIVQNAKQQVTVVETSARDGQGLQDIAKWIQDNTKVAPT